MSYVNQHSSRVNKSLNYIEYKTETNSDGVLEVFGRESGGDWILTGHRFDKEKFTLQDCKDYLANNSIDYIELVPAVAVAKAELTAVNVQLLSTLIGTANPSNRQPVIIKMKSQDGKEAREIHCKVVSKDVKLGHVTYIAMKGNYSDTDEEFYANETVEKSAHEFLILKGATNVSDTNHNLNIEKDVYLIESHIDKSDPESVEWRIKLDYSRSEKMMKVLDQITGISIFAYVSEIKQTGATKMLKKLIEKFKKMKADTMTAFNLDKKIDSARQAMWAFQDSIIKWNSTESKYEIVLTKEDLQAEINDLTTILNDVLFGSTEITKSIKNKDEEMTEEERKALKSEIVSEVTAAVTVAMKEALKETEPKKEPEKEPEKKVEPVETEVEKALKSQIAERDKEIKELKEKEAKRKSTSEIIEKDESDEDFLARMTEAMKEEDSWKTITMKEKSKFAQLRMKKAK
jgi:hypothetical protein